MAYRMPASVRENQKIAKKNKKIEKSEWEKEICWHCKHKQWRDYPENRDPDGIPITLDCPYRKPEFGHMLRTEPACMHFDQEL